MGAVGAQSYQARTAAAIDAGMAGKSPQDQNTFWQMVKSSQVHETKVRRALWIVSIPLLSIVILIVVGFIPLFAGSVSPVNIAFGWQFYIMVVCGALNARFVSAVFGCSALGGAIWKP